MSRAVLVVAASSLALGLAVAGWSAQPRSRTFVFTYHARVEEIPAGTKIIDLWAPLPTSNASQDVLALAIEAEVPVTIAEGELGNQMVHLRVDASRSLPIDLKLRVTVRRRERGVIPARLTKVERRRYLRPSRLVPITGRIRQLARQTTAGKTTDLEKAKAIYDEVTSSMKYEKAGEGRGRGDALYACDARKGNCTDFHALLIGMCRSVGLPARFTMGFPLPSRRGAAEIPGYHCWAEIYIGGQGWLPVDSSEAVRRPEKREYFFGHLDENRVQFTLGRDLTLAPPQQADELNYFIYPYAEADGLPTVPVSRTFTVRDLN